MIQSGLVWKLYLVITLLEKHQGDFMHLHAIDFCLGSFHLLTCPQQIQKTTTFAF